MNRDLTVEELRTKLDSILKITDIEDRTREIVDLKNKYPFIREEEPFKKCYWDFIKDWHKQLVEGEKKDPSLVDRIKYNMKSKSSLHPSATIGSPVFEPRATYGTDTSTFDSYNPKIKDFGLFLEAKAELDKDFLKLRDKYIKEEEEVAEKIAANHPDHPFIKKYWLKIAKLKTMTDPQEFLRAYKKLRGISKLDLDDELFHYWKDKKEIKKEKKEEKKRMNKELKKTKKVKKVKEEPKKEEPKEETKES